MADLGAQIALTADASGVEAGVGKAKRSIASLGETAARMGNDVAGAGDKARRGLDGLGSGGEQTARKVERDTRNMQGSLQRYLATLEAGSKDSRRYWEQMADFRGVDKRALEPLLQQLDAYKGGAREAGSASDRLGASFTALRAAASVAIGNVVVQSAASAAAALYDASVQAERLRIMLDFSSARGSTAEIAYLRKTTTELGLAFGSTATAYAQFQAAARGTAIEGQKARDVFESVARASAVMGLSADQTSGVLLALQQMVSKGTVQAEELRGQLGERLPGAFQIAARAMGVTTGELGKMLEQGQVVADDFLPKFARALNESLGDAAENAAGRLDASLNRVNSAWDRLKQNIGDSGVSKFWSGQMDVLTDGMDNFSRSVELARVSGSGFGGQLLAGAGAALQFINPLNALSYNALEAGNRLKAAEQRLEELKRAGASGYSNLVLRRATEDAQRLVDKYREAKAAQDALLGVTSSTPRDPREDNPGLTRGASYARWAKEQADSEKALADVRMRAAGVNKQYFSDLSTYQQALRVGTMTEKEYTEAVSQLAKKTWEASTAGREAAAAKKAGTKASDEAARAAEREAKAFDTYMNSLREKIAAQDIELAQGSQITESQKAQLDLDKLVANGRTRMTEARKAEAAAAIASLKNNEREIANRKQLIEVIDAERTGRMEIAKAEAARINALGADNTRLREEIELIGLSAEQQTRLAIAKNETAIASKEEQLARLQNANITTREMAALEEEIRILRERNQLLGRKAEKEQYFEAQSQLLETWKSIDKTAHDVFVNVFEDGAGTFKRLGQTLKSAVLDMLYQLTVRRWIISIGASITGIDAGLIGRALGGGGGSNPLGMASNANSAYGLFSGGMQGVYNGAGRVLGMLGYGGTAGAAPGSLAFANAVGAAGGDSLGAFVGINGWTTGGGAGAGGWLGANAAGLGVVAAPLIIGALMERFGYHNDNMRLTGAAYSTGTGKDPSPGVKPGSTYYDVMTGELPDRQALLDKLVGWGGDAEALAKFNDRTLYRMMAGARGYVRDDGTLYQDERGIPWQQFYDNMRQEDFYRGPGYTNPEAEGWWSNDQFYGVGNMDQLGVDPQMVAASRQIADSLVAPFVNFADTFKLDDQFRAAVGLAWDPDKPDRFWGGLNIQRNGESLTNWDDKRVFANQDEWARGMFSSTLEAFGKLDLPEWARTQVDGAREQIDKLEGDNIGQQAAEIYAQTTAGVVQMMKALQTLIDVFPDFAGVSQDSMFALQQLFGGLEGLQQSYGSYLQNFWSEEERADIARKQMSLSLAEVGLKLPETRDGFRSLVESLDLSTEEGRKAFAALMGIAGTFAEITPAADAAAEATAALIEQLSQQASSGLSNIIRDGMLGNFNGGDLGAAMAQSVTDGIYGAIAGHFANQITDIITAGVITPVIQAAITGSAVSAAVSAASIDAMIAQATAVANALAAIFSDPAFIAAMDQIGVAIAGIAGSLPSFGGAVAGVGSYASAVEWSGDAASDAASQVADAWKQIADSLIEEVKRIRGELADTADNGLSYWQSQFAILTAQARAGDQEAAGSLTGISRSLLDAYKSSAGSLLEYQQFAASIAQSLQDTAGYATSMAGIGGTGGSGGTGSAGSAGSEGRLSMHPWDVETRRVQEAIRGQMMFEYGWTREQADAFLDGGATTPTTKGRDTPYTGPLATTNAVPLPPIVTGTQGQDNRDLLAELKQMRERLEASEAQARLQAELLLRTTRALERWESLGMPATRTEVPA